MRNRPSTGNIVRPYRSYLIRLWQDDGQMVWRALAQSVQTGETVHFADLATLFAFLQAQTLPPLPEECRQREDL